MSYRMLFIFVVVQKLSTMILIFFFFCCLMILVKIRIFYSYFIPQKHIYPFLLLKQIPTYNIYLEMLIFSTLISDLTFTSENSLKFEPDELSDHLKIEMRFLPNSNFGKIHCKLLYLINGIIR